MKFRRAENLVMEDSQRIGGVKTKGLEEAKCVAKVGNKILY